MNTVNIPFKINPYQNVKPSAFFLIKNLANRDP